MTEWLIPGAMIFIALGGVGALGWVWRDHRAYRDKVDAETKAAQQEQRANATAKTAEIFSQPAGSKSDIIGRL